MMALNLNLSKHIKDLNKAAAKHVTPKQVEQIVRAALLCQRIFKQDDDKDTSHWLVCPNYNFGGASPVSLILINRGHKVIKFLEATLEGY